MYIDQWVLVFGGIILFGIIYNIGYRAGFNEANRLQRAEQTPDDDDDL